MRSRTTAVAAMAVLLLSACSNPRAANTANFTAALSRYMSSKNEEQCTQSIGLPVTIRTYDDYGNRQQNDTSQYDALVQSGLVTRSVHRVHHAQKTIGFFAYPEFTDVQTTYALSSKGRSVAGIGSKNFGGGYDTWFCYAKKIPGAVTNFTVPSNMGPAIMSEVTYTYMLSNVAPYATNSAFQRAYPDVKQNLDGAGSSQQNITMILTNNGWQAQ
jgi:hypothetical protein